MALLAKSATSFRLDSLPPGVRNGCAEMDSEPANLIRFVPA
jgi:hypothetical protein